MAADPPIEDLFCLVSSVFTLWPAIKGLPDLAAKASCSLVREYWEVFISGIDETKSLNVKYSFSHLKIKELTESQSRIAVILLWDIKVGRDR